MKISLVILIVFGFLFTMGCAKSGSQVVLQTISFTPETLKVKAGNIVDLQPVFTPAVFSNIDVVWSSTDLTTAYVDTKGEVTTFTTKPGTAWVTVKDKNSATAGKCLIIVQ